MSSEVINEKVQLERKTIIAHHVVIFKKYFKILTIYVMSLSFMFLRSFINLRNVKQLYD